MVSTQAKRWRRYIDEMGPKTKEYVESENPQYGIGRFASITKLKVISLVSKMNDDLGVQYASAIDNDVISGKPEFSMLRDPGLVNRALKNYLEEFKSFLETIERGNLEDIEFGYSGLFDKLLAMKN